MPESAVVPRRRLAAALVRQLEVGLPDAAGLQEDQHPGGEGLLLRLALLPGRRCRPRRSPPTTRSSGIPRSATWATRRAMWQWAMTMGLRKFQEMVFTGRPFTARADVRLQLREQRGAHGRISRPRRPSTRWPAARHAADGHRVHAEGLLRDHEAAPGRVHGQHPERLARVDGRPAAGGRRRRPGDAEQGDHGRRA